MLEVSKRHGVAVVKITAGEPLPRDSRVCLAQPGEWFALIERATYTGGAPRLGCATIDEHGVATIRWYRGAGSINVAALQTYASLENSRGVDWVEEKRIQVYDIGAVMSGHYDGSKPNLSNPPCDA
jgi:hypothetical protein